MPLAKSFANFYAFEGLFDRLSTTFHITLGLLLAGATILVGV
ncbi:MAG: hypothetical protein ACHP84_02775 [Caulobacterales bacterium]|jgi:hypothetical protein